MRKKTLIDALFPKTRQAVLAITIMQPDRWWFLADLARRIGVPSSSLQRELDSLVRAGILLRRQDGRQVYFRPDPQCPVLDDLQGLMLKTRGLVDVLRNMLAPFQKDIRTAFVYGSRARCEAVSASDVDLLIIGDVLMTDLASAIPKAEERLARQINPTLFSPEEFAKKIREGNHFLQTVLNGKKLFVLGSENDLAKTPGHAARPDA
jgi:DNA-binding transcriptional ArsR family regulator